MYLLHFQILPIPIESCESFSTNSLESLELTTFLPHLTQTCLQPHRAGIRFTFGFFHIEHNGANRLSTCQQTSNLPCGLKISILRNDGVLPSPFYFRLVNMIPSLKQRRGATLKGEICKFTRGNADKHDCMSRIVSDIVSFGP